MPIQAQCPNPACRQSLQVPDEYAGAQGKCPSCGTMVLFQPPAVASAPAAPPPVPSGNSPAYAAAAAPGTYTAAPPAPAAYDPVALPGQAPSLPAGPPLTAAQLVPMICLPAGLFFLFLLIICSLLPWFGIEGSTSGIGRGNAGIFLVLCLLVGIAGGLTYLFKWLLPPVAAIAAGLGILAFFIMLGAVVEYGRAARVGVWLGLFAAIGAAGAFVTLAVFRPVESPALHALKLPLMRPHGGLVLAVVFAVVVGFLYLILSAISAVPHTTGI